MDPIRAWIMASVQKPIAASIFGGDEAFWTPAWKVLPSWYLVREKDQMIPSPAQHFFAQRMVAITTSIVSSHASMVSHPDVVRDLIIKAAQAVPVK